MGCRQSLGEEMKNNPLYEFTSKPKGIKEWIMWCIKVMTLRRCHNCRWDWIIRRDIFFEGECHACWLWCK